MVEDNQATSRQFLSRSVVFKSAAAVLALAAIMAGAIAWRVSGRTGAPGFLSIFWWQVAVWLPWIGYYFVINYITRRLAAKQNVAVLAPIVHAITALLIATSHLVWYWQISSQFSPLVGMESTRFGVYQFFFIFWFLIDVLIYAGSVIAQYGEQGESKDSSTVGYANQFTVRKGRAQHIVRTEDINWIEAQGYYAGLHTSDALFLIRKSLSALEKELDPTQFVRVHRSTIVNVDQIERVQSATAGAGTVRLAHGGDRNVSRDGRRRLKEILSART